ncbi:hypothetical protein FB45DRAFT_931205 [Roridomyces roridus]|uniref:F-box domain-containing protein n=1 Tax=Roridomyces roridus TaxID=1738132 RepID=A0AAD7BFM9_9AGAR|nr:hypothetical protein FB45DRAFT_931205 [Roridomyces roridus]
MPTLDVFPPELAAEIFTHLPLKALVAAEGVCRQWKEFVAVADIYPSRRALFRLYQKIVHDPLFHDVDSRPWLWENLRPFDRQAYLDHILAQHNYIPEDFRLWILEWPNKAVIACAWPGLSAVYCAEEADNVERFLGYNHLGCLEPQLSKIDLDLRIICSPDASSDSAVDSVSFADHQRHRRRMERLFGTHKAEDTGTDVQETDSDEPPSRPPGYYHSLETFQYSPPPRSGELELPGLLIWEECGGDQTYLALSPDSPFAVYDIFGAGVYCDGSSQHPIRKMDGSIIDQATCFRSMRQSVDPWTEEDEAKYVMAHI